MHLEIVEVDLDKLIPYENNANIHSDHQVDQIAASIEEFGFADPIGVWENEAGEIEVVEGHGRILAAKKLGMNKVPVIYLNGLSDEQRRAYTHIHNQLTRNSVFDMEILEAEMQSLDFDWSNFGFENPELNWDPDTVFGAEENDRAKEESASSTVICPECGHEFEL